jgi:stage V sporulation protein SpoVS
MPDMREAIMVATRFVDSARSSVEAARDFALGQIDDQIHEVAAKLRTTSGSLGAMTEQLRKDPFIAAAAPFIEQAETAVAGAAAYLEERGIDRIAVDVETFSRERPITATLVATLVGFAVSRAVKASSVRRYESSDSARA